MRAYAKFNYIEQGILIFMAVLYPQNLRSSVRQDPKLRAEVQVYDQLREVLDDKYHVFHSVTWTNIDDHGRETDGECDFVVAHPVHGILAIEVKGGVQISYNKNTDVWSSKDHKKRLHNIKDPLKQVKNAKHQIKKSLDKSNEWPKQNIHIAHGLIFPGVAAPEESLGLRIGPEHLCCSDQLRTGLGKWVERRLKVGRKDRSIKPLGDNGIVALKKIFGDSIRLNSNVRIAIDEARTEYTTLEPRLKRILRNINRFEKALIEGGAGTGKSVLAMEEAKRFADSGLKTLYSCYNKPLALYIARKLGNQENLTIKTFHSLCLSVVEEFGHTMPSRNGKDNYYNHQLPDALFDIMTKNPDRCFDAIIIDEGQDFLPHWRTVILASLKKAGKIRVFADNNQNVYSVNSSWEKDIETTPVELNTNYRNSKCIHRVASLHYKGVEIEADCLDGIEVSWNIAHNTQKKIEKCILRLRQLLENDKVDQGDIAVLFNQQSSRGEFLKQINEQKIGINTTDAEKLNENSIVVDTVRRFKGLERMAIVWVVDGNELQSRELAYVGFSRARAYLCVISSKKDQKWLKGDITLQSKHQSTPSSTLVPSPTPASPPKPVSSPTPVAPLKPVHSSTLAPSHTPVSSSKPILSPIIEPYKNSTSETVDKNWIEEAKYKATSCNTLEELKSAFEAFECSQLKESTGKGVVFEGAIGANFVVVGEYQDGVSPFDGSAGELLDEMLASVNRSRAKNTLLTYLNYWRTRNDRKPHTDELAICRPFVDRMITLTRPKLILSVGAVALKSIRLTSESVSQLRGRLFNLKINDIASFKVFPTFHPGYLLKHPQEKSKAWRDLLKVEELLNSD